MKIFNGSDQLKRPPYLELKASPAKLLQGHNVFGSTNIRVCALAMLLTLASGMPEIYEMVDIDEASVDWIDVTFSSHVNSESVRKQVISFLQNVRAGQTRKTKYNKEYETTAEWNSGSEHRSLKVYLKGDEVQTRLSEAVSELKKSPSKKYLQNTIDVLSDPKIIEFSKKCIRFEARLKGRYLDKHQIPRNLFKLISYQEDYEKQGRSLVKDLWKEAI